MDNISNLCVAMTNIMNQNISHCYKKEIEDMTKKDFDLDHRHLHHHNHNHHDIKARKEFDQFLDFAVLTPSAEAAVQRFFR